MKLPPVPNAQTIIDQALDASTKAVQKKRSAMVGVTRATKSREIELERITVLSARLRAPLVRIIESFPSFETLPEYQKELLYVSLDYAQAKKSLGAVMWAERQLRTQTRTYSRSIKSVRGGKHLADINTARKAFVGRACSFIKQIATSLETLRQARTVLVSFPSLVLEEPIVCIAGFPNVGKSTLLKAITGADVAIAPYAFTTKKLSVGTLEKNGVRIQFIDTPGTLNREKMNAIERQAYIAMRFCANVIVYVFDPTHTYPLEQQQELFEHIASYRKPIVCYISKTDIADAKAVQEITRLQACYTDKDALTSELFATYFKAPKRRRRNLIA